MEESAVTNVCRVCLTEEGEFQSLFVPDESTGSNIHLAEMLMAYASVQASSVCVYIFEFGYFKLIRR